MRFKFVINLRRWSFGRRYLRIINRTKGFRRIRIRAQVVTVSVIDTQVRVVLQTQLRVGFKLPQYKSVAVSKMLSPKVSFS